MYRYILLCFVQISIYAIAFGQHIAIKFPSLSSYDKFYYKIYDLNGKLTLTLPDEAMLFGAHTLIKKNKCDVDKMTFNSAERTVIECEDFILIDKTQQFLPVTSPDSTYLINFQGKIIKSFGKKYAYVSQMSDGIFIGYSPINRSASEFMLTYFNQDGVPMFNGKMFWEATLFSEGYAIVQEKKEVDEWIIINENGAQIFNITKALNKKIFKAEKFINGYANILAYRTDKEAELIVERIKNNEDSVQYYFDIPLNSKNYESRIETESFRVSINGELQRLNWKSSMLNDIYNRLYYTGRNFQNDNDAKREFETEIFCDSLVTSEGKFYITRDSHKQYRLKNIKGENVPFPDQYSPLICTQNYILGKRNDYYVIHDPIKKQNTFFKDGSPMSFDMAFTNSEDPPSLPEEYIFADSRLIKIGCTGVNSLLMTDGTFLSSFESIDFNNQVSPMMQQITNIYKCPNDTDIKGFISEKREYLTIDCKVIDLQKFVQIENLKMLNLINTEVINNSSILMNLLNKDVEINIYGNIIFKDLKLDSTKITRGSLTINDLSYFVKK